MSGSEVAGKYADALTATIAGEDEFHRVKEDLHLVEQLLKKDVTLRSGMETPLFSGTQKKELVSSIGAECRLGEKSQRFLTVLLEENRFHILPEVLTVLDDSWFRKTGMEKCVVYSVIELSEDEKQRLAAQLARAFEHKVVLENQLDSALIAGIKIQRGSIFYDFSIAGNLKRLRSSIIETESPSGSVDLGD